MSGAADKQQVGIRVRVDFRQAQTVRSQPRTPGDVNGNASFDKGIPHCLRAEHISRGGFAILK
jgi:hypothetical protein